MTSIPDRLIACHSQMKKYFALVEGIGVESGGEIRLTFRVDPEKRPYQVYDPIRASWVSPDGNG